MILIPACDDPAEFRPAKGVTDLPALKTAYRVKRADPDCKSLGFILADGDHGLEDIATTAARHGANTYVIRNDDTDERVAEQVGTTFVERTNHHYSAEAFRCPSSPGPN